MFFVITASAHKQCNTVCAQNQFQNYLTVLSYLSLILELPTEDILNRVKLIRRNDVLNNSTDIPVYPFAESQTGMSAPHNKSVISFNPRSNNFPRIGKCGDYRVFRSEYLFKIRKNSFRDRFANYMILYIK